MTLARIITQYPENTHTLADALRARGFQVETRHSSEASSVPVDFEITIEECSAEEAIQRAGLEAGPRGMVFITSGTIAGSPPLLAAMPQPSKVVHEAALVTNPGLALEPASAENPSQVPTIEPVIEVPDAATASLMSSPVETAAPGWGDGGTTLSDLVSVGLRDEDVAMTFEPDSATAPVQPEAILPAPGPHLVPTPAVAEATPQIESSVLSRAELSADHQQPVSLSLNLELKVQTQPQKTVPQPAKIDPPAAAEMVVEAATLSSAEAVPQFSNAPSRAKPIAPESEQSEAAPEVSPQNFPVETPFFGPHSRPQTSETAHAHKALEVVSALPRQAVWFRRVFGKDPFFWVATTLAAGLAAVAALLLGFSSRNLPPDKVHGSGSPGQAPFAEGRPAASKPAAGVATAVSPHSHAVSTPRHRSVPTGDDGYVAKDIVIRYGKRSAGSGDKPAAQPNSNLIPARPR